MRRREETFTPAPEGKPLAPLIKKCVRRWEPLLAAAAARGARVFEEREQFTRVKRSGSFLPSARAQGSSCAKAGFLDLLHLWAAEHGSEL
jgi:hypothetical protein